MSPALPREERVSTISLRAIALSDPEDTAKTGALALVARLAADELDATRDALDAAEAENERLQATYGLDRDDKHPCIRVEAYLRLKAERDAARAEVAALLSLCDEREAMSWGVTFDGEPFPALLTTTEVRTLLAADEGERTGR